MVVLADVVDSGTLSALRRAESSGDPAIKAAAARHDLVVIELLDPKDHEPPVTGPVVLRDAESGRIATLSGKRWAREHAALRSRQRRELLQLTRRLAVDHLTIRTDRPYLGPLIRFFERRRRRFSR